MTISIAVMVMQVFFLLTCRSEPNCHNYRTWIKVSTGIYLLDFIACLNQLMFIKKTGRENYIMFGICVFITALNTSWYAYGNAIYFKYWQECSGTQEGNANNLTSTLYMMILFGYLTMCKCFFYLLLGCILIPLLCCLMRQANRPQWVGAAPNIVKDLAKGKYTSDPENSMDSCAICMVDFTQSDTVITLPCNKKHIFHDECIKKWLLQKNCCPLCNTQITKEMLKEQKR